MDKSSFVSLVRKLELDPVFYNASNVPQEAVDLQLLVVLSRFGSSGNGAAVKRISAQFSISGQ